VYNPAIESLDRLEPLDTPRSGGIRDQLRKWHEEHGHDQSNVVHDHDVNALGETTNNFTRLSDVDNLRRPHESLENDRDDTSQLIQAHPADLEHWDPNHRFFAEGRHGCA